MDHGRAMMQALKRALPVSVKTAAHQLIWPYRRATSRFRALPDFLVIGAQKSGTTSLFYYLSQHPDILPSSRKEVCFFDGGVDVTDVYAKGEQWYRSHFPYSGQLAGRRITGEASPSYIFNPLVPERIANFIPEAKLIAILRNPTERAVSHYFHEKRKGRETLSLEEALRAEESRLAEVGQSRNYKNHQFLHASYKSRGRYWEQIERYLQFFPRDQLHILSSEDLFRDPNTALDKVYDFLGMGSSHRLHDLRPQNVARNRTSVSPELYEYLDDYFLPHNQRLYELIGQKFDW